MHGRRLTGREKEEERRSEVILLPRTSWMVVAALKRPPHPYPYPCTSSFHFIALLQLQCFGACMAGGAHVRGQWKMHAILTNLINIRACMALNACTCTCKFVCSSAPLHPFQPSNNACMYVYILYCYVIKCCELQHVSYNALSCMHMQLWPFICCPKKI